MKRRRQRAKGKASSETRRRRRAAAPLRRWTPDRLLTRAPEHPWPVRREALRARLLALGPQSPAIS